MELHQARSLRGTISFLARESRPDLSGPAPLLQGMMPNLKLEDLLEANRVVWMTEEMCDLKLKVKHIPFHEMARVAFNDAASAKARDGASQVGCMFPTSRQMLKGEAAPITMDSWKSHKFKRTCAHQFGAETLAMSEGMAIAELTRTMLLEIVDPKFDLTRPSLLAGRFHIVSATDSKGGYDHATNPKAGLADDKRAAIDVAIARSALQRLDRGHESTHRPSHQEERR